MKEIFEIRKLQICKRNLYTTLFRNTAKYWAIGQYFSLQVMRMSYRIFPFKKICEIKLKEMTKL